MSIVSRVSRFDALLLLLLLAALIAYGLTMRAGLDWSEDPAHYLQHAVNLADGQDYNHLATPDYFTGRIFSYPYGLPAVLALIYKVTGLDLYLSKWLMVASLLLFAALFAWYVRRYRVTSDTLALLVPAAFLANPTVWDIKDDVLTDAPFLLVSFLALILYDTLGRPGQARSAGRTLGLILLSFALVASYSLRSVGLALPAAIVGFEILRYRRVQLTTIAVLIPFGVYLAIEYFAGSSLSGYVENSVTGRAGHVMFDYMRLIERVERYRWALGDLFSSERWPLFDAVLFYGLLGVPAAVGYAARFGRKLTAFEIYVPIYLAMFVVANVATYSRYMLPLAALMVLYAAEGIAILSARLKLSALAPGIVLAAALLLSYGLRYTTLDYQRFAEGLDNPSARQLVDWITANTGKDDVLAAQKAYSLRLLTQRTFAKLGYCPDPEKCTLDDPERVWRYLKFVGADYIIIKKTDWPHGFYPSDARFVAAFVTPYRDRLQTRFENADFLVLAITGYPVAGS